MKDDEKHMRRRPEIEIKFAKNANLISSRNDFEKFLNEYGEREKKFVKKASYIFGNEEFAKKRIANINKIVKEFRELKIEET